MEQLILNALMPFATNLVANEVNKVAPELLSKLPGALGALAKDVFARPEVQAEISKLEKQGLEGIVKLGEEGFALLKAKIQEAVAAHVNGYTVSPSKPGDNAPNPNMLHLSAQQMVAALKHQAAGTLDQALGVAIILPAPKT